MLYTFLLFLLIVVVLYFIFFNKCVPYKKQGLVTRKIYNDKYEAYSLIVNVNKGMFLDVFIDEETFNKVQVGKFYVCELFDCENDVYINKIYVQ